MGWREIDLTTDEGLRALDQVIAERLGWTDFHTESHWFDEPLLGSYEREMLMAAHPVFSEYREVPAYSSNTDAALGLIEPIATAQFTLQYHTGTGWRVWIDLRGIRYTDVAVTAALAISVVWLDWHDGHLKREEVDDGLA